MIGISITNEPDKEEVEKAVEARKRRFTSADIVNICNEVALVAARSKKNIVVLHNFEAVVDGVSGDSRRIAS